MGTFLLVAILLLQSGCSDRFENSYGYYEDGLFYYVDGSLGEGDMLDEKMEGPWKFYNAQRQLSMEGEMINNEMEGAWVHFFPTGILESSGTYSKGIQNGAWLHFHENGELKNEGLFENGRKNKSWAFFHDNGQKESEGIYKIDQRIGIWQFWYPDGQAQENRTYKEGISYLSDSWFPDGTQMVVAGNGEFEYIDYGRVTEKGQYVDSLAHGTWIFYDKDGEPTKRLKYDMGAVMAQELL